MKKDDINKLIELIDQAVNGDEHGTTWIEKRDAILRECTESDKTNLEEFAGWFEGA